MMDAEKWQKIKEIFNQMVEVEFAQRASMLDSVCQGDAEIRAEVEKLLAEDASDKTLFDPFISPISVVTVANPSGRKIGKYRLLREVGEGGMGSVFLAERDDLGNKVALKIVKKGMDTVELLRRFQTEQQILANLEHPNIARLLDNGTTDDGLPFYVMEYVEGEELLNYAHRQQISSRARLEIFRKICAAVQYAHNHLVVHRDLKPSNIMITKESEPKLLDFGIAKLINPTENQLKGTATLLGMMTPNYASPEQFRGETVTTSTDIYSLGVILYELMTGFLPLDLKNRTLDEMLKIILTVEPRMPSQTELKTSTEHIFAAQLKGDLDNIILKALKKEPERRYLSAEQFSEDIRRHLEGLPVRARPDTFSYRTSKFIQRNKLGVGAALLILLSLIGGIIGTSYQAQVAQRERERAGKRFEDIRQLSNRLIFKYNDAISNLPGATSTRAMFVQEATQFLDSLAEEQSNDLKLRLELTNAYLKIADLQGEISTFDVQETLKTYQKALKLAQILMAASPQDIEIKKSYASALKNVGKLETLTNLKDSALDNLEKASNIRQELFKLDADDFENNIGLVETYLSLGDFYQPDQPDLATENLQKAIQLSEKLINDPTATSQVWRLFAITNEHFANFLKDTKPAESIIYQNKAVEFYSQVLENKPNTIRAKKELGIGLLRRANTYKKLGKMDFAAKDLQQAGDIFEKLLQTDRKDEELRQLATATGKGVP